MQAELDGLISFFASHHAIKAETTLRRAGLGAQVIPGPKELSPNCGVALRFAYARRDEVRALLGERRVQFEAIHAYVPRTDRWDARFGAR
ncbi:MAG TPA: DUF3343 domain-containing protein [Chloroflexaceae bacterium]|nr:DUF3343 domain-containing protein [Chloroflexaceae bacterium]